MSFTVLLFLGHLPSCPTLPFPPEIWPTPTNGLVSCCSPELSVEPQRHRMLVKAASLRSTIFRIFVCSSKPVMTTGLVYMSCDLNVLLCLFSHLVDDSTGVINCTCWKSLAAKDGPAGENIHFIYSNPIKEDAIKDIV